MKRHQGAASFSTRTNILHRRDHHDRQFLTRPWTVMKSYRRHTQNITWEENNCIEANNYVTNQ